MSITIAGPVRGETGAPLASVLIYNTTSSQEARSLLEADPYFSARIWKSITLQPFLPAAGEWICGKTW